MPHPDGNLKAPPPSLVQKPKGHTAVMAHRHEPPDSLDFFPTPPWATRALMSHVLAHEPLEECTCWEPAAGEGHMALVLAERFRDVLATDVHDYGALDQVGSFTGEGADVIRHPDRFDWIVTNPPFKLGIGFAERAVRECWRGAALLVRLSWLESAERYEFLTRCPPAVVALFSERVPMCKGRWDPDASTATAYAWVVWKRAHCGETVFQLIPPGQRRALERAGDRQRFARSGA